MRTEWSGRHRLAQHLAGIAGVDDIVDAEMLGGAQLDFLDRAFRTSVGSGQPWRLVANQIIMARVFAPNLKDRVSEEKIVELEKEWDQVRAFIEFSTLGLPYNLDAWDGYPAARERFYNVARSAGARDLIVLTGDTHEAWGNDLYADDDTRMGVELGTTSVTSPGGSRLTHGAGGNRRNSGLRTSRKPRRHRRSGATSVYKLPI